MLNRRCAVTERNENFWSSETDPGCNFSADSTVRGLINVNVVNEVKLLILVCILKIFISSLTCNFDKFFN